MEDAQEEQAIINAVFLALGWEKVKDPRKRYSDIDLSVSAQSGRILSRPPTMPPSWR